MNDNFRIRSGIGIIDEEEPEEDKLSVKQKIEKLSKLRQEIEEEIAIISEIFSK